MKNFSEIFPKSDLPGTDCSDIDKDYMVAAAKQSDQISLDDWNVILKKHEKFLKGGGGGGTWQTMNLNGIILGMYSPIVKNNGNKTKAKAKTKFRTKFKNKIKKGEHALLNNRRLDNLPLKGVGLAYANLSGILCKNQDFSNAYLNHALMTDSILEGTSFNGADLIGVDFSRSNLRGTDFRNTNLKNADFENCDLTGANFQGAKLKDSRFPGAILKDIKI